MTTPPPAKPRNGPVYRALLKHARTLHTYFSMLATVLFLFFACTGFMLNHAGWFGLDSSRTTTSTVTIPAKVLAAKDKLGVVEFLRANGAAGAVDPFDWPGEGEPFHIGFKSPRAQCDADITLPGGECELAVETRGITGLLTRLHTAREAGPIWQLVLDGTAITLFVVCITGLILWQSLPKRRVVGAVALGLSVGAVVLAYCLCVP
jgi:hypothetical protein